jgi:UDP-N-acetylglucosamine 2-epimerase (non-hydrolysing)
MLKLDLIVGARPNLMKIAPLFHGISQSSLLEARLIHTGQHNSAEMSEVFFQLFSLPKPNYSLSEASGTPSQQIAKIMNFYDGIIQESRPDICIVVGDVTSSLACSLVAVKEGITTCHVEAGLRSGDRTMPEEINRIIIDVLADILYTPSPDAQENLLRENKPLSNIHPVGNIMIDSFEMMKDVIGKENAYLQFRQSPKSYGLVTFHRPANVDNPETLRRILTQLITLSQDIPLIFPIHPRTKSKIQDFGLEEILKAGQVVTCEPLDYLSFMSLVINAKIVITDSGGVQEETTYLGIPCLTVRENTERPITITQGTNQLVHVDELHSVASLSLKFPKSETQIPDLWDGKTASRIVEHLESLHLGSLKR